MHKFANLDKNILIVDGPRQRFWLIFCNNGKFETGRLGFTGTYVDIDFRGDKVKQGDRPAAYLTKYLKRHVTSGAICSVFTINNTPLGHFQKNSYSLWCPPDLKFDVTFSVVKPK